MNPLRRWILGLFGVLGWVVVGLPAWPASANDEPYVLIENTAEPLSGRTVYSISVGYSPQAFSGQAWDQQGRPYALNGMMREWSLRATARKDWNDRWSFVVGSRYHRLTIVEERMYAGHREEIRTVEGTWGMQLGIQSKWQPGHPLEPKAGLAFAWPEQTVEAQLGWSMVRDPVVLSGSLGYGKDFKNETTALTAGFGLGLVANEVLSIELGLQHLMAMETWASPTNRLALSVGYVVDHARGRQVNFETAFWSDGERFIVSFGLGWTARRL